MESKQEPIPSLTDEICGLKRTRDEISDTCEMAALSIEKIEADIHEMERNIANKKQALALSIDKMNGMAYETAYLDARLKLVALVNEMRNKSAKWTEFVDLYNSQAFEETGFQVETNST